jgi:excisionase family DNA binding protein
MTEGKLLYRPSEAAESLSISRAKLYQLLAQGQIASVKIAASRRIPAAELRAYVDRLQVDSQPIEQTAQSAAAQAAA